MIRDSPAEKQQTITVNRTFHLPLDTVWKAWSECDSFTKWWGPKEFTCPNCVMDFKEGGQYLNSMCGPDRKEIWSTGTYKEIIPKKKIVYTDSFADDQGNIVPASYYNMPGDWDLELLVSIEFEEVDGNTHLSMEHSGLPAEISSECIHGWQSSFDKLESNLKS